MQCIVDGLITHYERGGSGPTLLIIPGWADTSRSWQAVSGQLAASYDIIRIDLPGFGGSQQPPTAWGLDEYAAFVGNFLTKLGISEIEACIGHSNGGSIAVRAVAQSKIRPKKLVLIASAGIRNTKSPKKLLLKLAAKTGKVMSAPLPVGVQRRLRTSLYGAAGSDLLVAEHMQESFKKVVAQDVQNDAASIRLPTLLIYGDHDQDTPAAFGQTYEKLIKQARLVTIPGAGHFVHVDRAALIASEIERHLTRNPK